MSSMATLEARLRAAGLRVRAMRALEAAVWGAAVGFGVVALASLAHWLAPAHVPPLSRGLPPLLLLVLGPAFAAIVAASRAVPPLPLLTTLDQSHGLSDLLSSAWALSRLPETQRGAFVEATITRAEHAASAVELRRSFPWRRPAGLAALAVAVAAVAGTWLMPPQPSASAKSVAHGPPLRPLERLVSPAQLARFREQLARMDADARAGERASTVRTELDRVLDELARGPADRLHVLRRLGELEQMARLTASGERTPEVVALDSARRVSTTPAAAPSSPPREAADGPAARGQTEPLASPAPAEAAAPPSPVEAAAPPAPAPPPAAAPPPEGAPPQAAPPLGSPAQREGEPSPPDPAQPPRTGGQGSSPPAAKEARPVAAAPSQPGDDNGPRGPDLERQRAERNAERQRAENLADAISELRDLMRRDQTVQADLDDPSQAPPPRERASNPERNDSAGNRPGAPNAAYARGGAAPRAATETSDSTHEDTPQLPAAASRVSGARSAGPVRSQVIYGAAQRGFAGSDYARVHAEYEDHAERELEREAIPPGYRGYVRRYFEAIAPRKTP
jgi:hypothetical protein